MSELSLSFKNVNAASAQDTWSETETKWQLLFFKSYHKKGSFKSILLYVTDKRDYYSTVFTFSSGWILSTGRSNGFLLFRFSIADWASAIAHLSIGWGKVFWTRSWKEGIFMLAFDKFGSIKVIWSYIAQKFVISHLKRCCGNKCFPAVIFRDKSD